jgi:hypothetical protein
MSFSFLSAANDLAAYGNFHVGSKGLYLNKALLAND